MALSKNRIKYIHSLEQKKHRKAEGVFLAEGPKLINDLLGKFACPLLVATAEWLSAHPHPDSEEIIEATEEELAEPACCAPPSKSSPFSASPRKPQISQPLPVHYAWRWMAYRTPAIWEPSSDWPIGLG